MSVRIPAPVKGIMGGVMRRREACSRVMDDYDRALGRFTRPQFLCGVATGKHAQIYVNGRVIVQIMETGLDDILRWHEQKVNPIWKVQVVRDPDGYGRGLRTPYIYGPAYELGFGSSMGPWSMISNTEESCGQIR